MVIVCTMVWLVVLIVKIIWYFAHVILLQVMQIWSLSVQVSLSISITRFDDV